ncbi:DMT family transporter [Azospirillum canadense]|uniref:DMT family transporter n=1 Tax=Azospirillum canadense TaxID=403962 RepID=UPI0022279EE9|nr:DMT family transporter [Azospirillum canadense]MCW2239655.1 drug/metabolite transporter (DMT)-like permease [Azospirillum canadense]
MASENGIPTDGTMALPGKRQHSGGFIRALLTSRIGKTSKWVGPTFVLIFLLLSVSTDVGLGHLLQDYDPVATLVLCFGMVIGFFLMVNSTGLKAIFNKGRRDWQDILLLNLSTAGSWAGLFFALRYFEPAMAISFIHLIGPVVTLALEPWFGNHKKPSGLELVSAFGIVAGMVFLGIITSHGKSGVGAISNAGFLVGTLMSLLAGISVVCNTLFSRRVAGKGWSTSEVMTVRFYALALFALCACSPNAIQPLLNASALLPIALIACLGIIVPLYTLQLGIERTDPLVVALLLTNSPLATILLQNVDQRLSPAVFSVVGIGVCACFSTLGVIARIGNK